jgi:hypothetical protein
MKTPITHACRLLLAIAVASMAAACSDGELLTSGVGDITAPTPSIAEFYANPESVKAGESTTITWKAVNADAVEITAVASDSSPVSFHVETTELEGSAVASGLTATTNFTITATKTTVASTDDSGSAPAGMLLAKGGEIRFGPDVAPTNPSQNPGTTPSAPTLATETITVVVVSGSLGATMAADAGSVAAGERTVIRWEVTPPDGVTTVVSSDSGEAIVATDKCDGDIEAIAAEAAVEPMPAKGCAVVAPTSKTVYTVNGIDASGRKGEASATVDVTKADINAEIFLSADAQSEKVKHLQVGSYTQPIVVSWKVTPAAAKVTITAQSATGVPSATDCPLPTAAVDQAEGSVTCKVSSETKFLLHAELGAATDDDDADVTLKIGNAALMIADQWAFEGEQVTLDIALAPSSDPNQIEQILIDETPMSAENLAALTKNGDVKVAGVRVKAPSVSVKLMPKSGMAVEYKTVQVVDLSVKMPDEDVSAVTSIAFGANKDGELDRFAGVQMGGVRNGAEVKSFNKGVARLYRNGGAINFDFGKSIKEAAGMQKMWTDAFFDNLAAYPVAVALKAGSPQDIVAGVTGAVMRSKDGGTTWENIMVTRRRAASSSVSPDHITCGRGDDGGQKILTGGKRPEFSGDFISLNEICDISARADGRVIVATDFGIQVEDNIDDATWSWKGTPAVGKTGEEEGYVTFGHVVNKLLDLQPIDGTEKIFAAVDNGVFVSVDKGVSWTKFGTQTAPVFALAYDARNKQLYIGDGVGISAASIEDGNSFAAVGNVATAVLAIAIDPNTPVASVTIVAGTPTGMVITRDGGVTWTKLALPGGDREVRALGLVSTSTSTNVNYGIALGTSGGELFRSFKVSTAMEIQPQEQDQGGGQQTLSTAALGIGERKPIAPQFVQP